MHMHCERALLILQTMDNKLDVMGSQLIGISDGLAQVTNNQGCILEQQEIVITELQRVNRYVPCTL